MQSPLRVESKCLRKKTITFWRRLIRLDVWPIKSKEIKSSKRRSLNAWLKLISKEMNNWDRIWSRLKLIVSDRRKLLNEPNKTSLQICSKNLSSQSSRSYTIAILPHSGSRQITMQGRCKPRKSKRTKSKAPFEKSKTPSTLSFMKKSNVSMPSLPLKMRKSWRRPRCCSRSWKIRRCMQWKN